MSEWYIVPTPYAGAVRYPPESQKVLVFQQGRYLIATFSEARWHAVGLGYLQAPPTHWAFLPKEPHLEGKAAAADIV